MLLANGRTFTGPTFMGIKSISVYIKHVPWCADWVCTLFAPRLGGGVLWEGALPVLVCFPPWHWRSEEQMLQRVCRRVWGALPAMGLAWLGEAPCR